jgi:hypothetical protein
MKLIMLLVMLLPVRAFSASQTLEFKRNGKLMRSFSLAELQNGKLDKIKAIEVDLYNAWMEDRRVYVGYDFFKVLDAIYGKNWRKSAMLAFVASDGYISHSDIGPMLKVAANKTGLIAYAEKNQNGFTLIQHGNKEIDPGPFYLVWSNFKESDRAAHSDVLKWPYQLVEINLQDTAQ